MATEIRSCKTCAHSVLENIPPNIVKVRFCRALPPQLVNMGAGVMAVFPQVQDATWCAQHAPVAGAPLPSSVVSANDE